MPVSEVPRIGKEMSTAATDDDDPMSFEEFVEHLSELVIIPIDRNTRKRWLSIARELHGMSGL